MMNSEPERARLAVSYYLHKSHSCKGLFAIKIALHIASTFLL